MRSQRGRCIGFLSWVRTRAATLVERRDPSAVGSSLAGSILYTRLTPDNSYWTQKDWSTAETPPERPNYHFQPWRTGGFQGPHNVMVSLRSSLPIQIQFSEN